MQFPSLSLSADEMREESPFALSLLQICSMEEPDGNVCGFDALPGNQIARANRFRAFLL